MHLNYTLGNVITLILNIVHVAMYLEVRKPRRLRFATGLVLLFLPCLAPWFELNIPHDIDRLWLLLHAAYFLYSLAVFRFVMFEGNYSQILFAMFAVGCFNNICLTFIQLAFLDLLDWPAASLTFLPVRASQLVLCAALYPLIYRYIRQPFRQILGVIGQGKWHVRNITPMFFFIMGYMVIGIAYAHPGDLATMLALSVAGATVSHYVAVYLQMVQEGRNRFLNEMIESSRKMLPVYEHYNAELDRKERTIRTLRHDLRHVLGSLSLAAQDGDPAALAQFARSVAGMDDGTEIHAHSDNKAVNAIVSFYFSFAAGSGAKCEAKLAIPENIPLSDAELVMLFGNALENCAKAVAPLGKEGTIAISARTVKDCLVFKAINNYRPGDKGRGEGLGIDSMRMLCEKHGGRLDLEARDGEFMLTAILKLE